MRIWIAAAMVALAGCGAPRVVQDDPATTVDDDGPAPVECVFVDADQGDVTPSTDRVFLWRWPGEQIGEPNRCAELGNAVPPCVAPTFDQCIRKP